MVGYAKIIAFNLGVDCQKLVESLLAVVVSTMANEISCKVFYYIIHYFEFVSRFEVFIMLSRHKRSLLVHCMIITFRLFS